MKAGKRSDVLAETFFCFGFVFVTVLIASLLSAMWAPCNLGFPFFPIIGGVPALLFFRRSRVAKVIGLGVPLAIISLNLWTLKSRLHWLWDGRFFEFFGG